MECNCKKNQQLNDLQFMRCKRGFLFRVGAKYDGFGEMFAFDNIEDAAAWLVEQFRDAA